MTSSGRSVGGPDGENGRVMAAIDGDAPDRRLIIADTEADDAWVSVAVADARPLAEWT